MYICIGVCVHIRHATSVLDAEIKIKKSEKRKKKRNKMLIIFRLNHLHFFPVCSQCSGQSFSVEENKKKTRTRTRTHIHWAAGATRPQTTSAYVGRPGKLINGFNELDEL